MARQIVRKTRNLAVEQMSRSQKAKADLEKAGLYLPNKPKYEQPDLESAGDLTELDDSGLMLLFTTLTAWADYLGGQLALAEIDERASEAVLKKAEAVSMLRSSPTSGKVTMAKAEKYEDPVVEEAQESFMKNHAYRKLLNVLYNNVDRDASLVSRELTRRVGMEPNRRREGRWSA